MKMEEEWHRAWKEGGREGQRQATASLLSAILSALQGVTLSAQSFDDLKVRRKKKIGRKEENNLSWIALFLSLFSFFPLLTEVPTKGVISVEKTLPWKQLIVGSFVLAR